MLSILIPIYQRDVTKLVHLLHRQCIKCNIGFEIICFDDFSKETYRNANRSLQNLMYCSYIELWENKGRSKIRNLLAQNARYENLLFLDSDCKIKHQKFVLNYVQSIQEGHSIINGGRKYSRTKPKNTKKVLHWKYGVQNEAARAPQRKRYPYQLFHSNNFVIKRDLLLKHPFDENVEGYGYEDLCFAEQLKSSGYKIHHIENAVFHGGLEIRDSFLHKIEESIENLIRLYATKKISDTRLLRTYAFLENWKLSGLTLKLLTWSESRLRSNLHSSNPQLWRLQAWKLLLFLRGIKN